MVLEHIAEWIATPGDLPNRLTLAMGDKVRQARSEAGLSQAELADRVYRRQAAISQIENGIMRLDVETLVYLAGVLKKPIRYFFPDTLLFPVEGELCNWEREYLDNIRKLTPTDRRRVAEYVDLLARATLYEERELRQRIKESIADLDLPDSSTDDLPHE
jgi:transcriptional regulator with XRE-family HTH domain